jgi:SPP1 gp7 family putative phage head morphogenesis protein
MTPLEIELRRQRRRLLAHELTVQAELGRVYGMVYRRLMAQYRELEKAIEAEVRAGRKPKVSWVVRQEQYTKLIADVIGEIGAFGRQAAEIIANGQQGSLTQLNADSWKLTEAALGPAPATAIAQVETAYLALSDDALRKYVGFASDGSALAELFKSMPGKSVRNISDTIAHGIATGQNPKVTARAFAKAAKVPMQRAVTIARTETIRAHNAASIESYEVNSQVTKGWQWHAELDSRTCSACVLMSGTEHANGDPMNQHINCRCSAVPLTKSWADLGFPGIKDTQYKIPKGVDVFKGMSPAEQRQILGPGKYELYKNGTPFEKFAHTHKSDKWPDQIRAATVTEAKAA